jgi:hypothetical protein
MKSAIIGSHDIIEQIVDSQNAQNIDRIQRHRDNSVIVLIDTEHVDGELLAMCSVYVESEPQEIEDENT